MKNATNWMNRNIHRGKQYPTDRNIMVTKNEGYRNTSKRN